MGDDRLAIGAFSRATGISVNTLRSYHELGLLVPSRVDRQTGYRSYTVDQLADAVVVVRLRALDVPLAQVREIIDARDPALTRRILAEHERTMQQRLADTERIIAELQHGLAPTTHTPVHVEPRPAMTTVHVVAEVRGDELVGWLARSHERLRDVIDAAGADVVGPDSALYDAEIALDDVERVVAFVPVADPFVVPRSAGDVRIGEVPAGVGAVLVHQGDFADIGDTYRALGAWVARHAEPSGERVCERYLVGPRQRADAASHRTEIWWPIREMPTT